MNDIHLQGVDLSNIVKESQSDECHTVVASLKSLSKLVDGGKVS